MKSDKERKGRKKVFSERKKEERGGGEER